MSPADWQKSNEPRRVQRGLKLSRSLESRLDEEPVSFLIKELDTLVSSDLIVTGQSWARMGQVREIEVGVGFIKGLVQGTRAQPHDVNIQLGVISPASWERIIERVSDEAGCIVELQEGKVSKRLIEICKQESAGLIPVSESINFEVDGKKSDINEAVYCLALIGFSRFINEPLRLLSLRGLPVDQFLGRIQRVRALAAGGQAFAHQSPDTPDQEKLSFEDSCDFFWDGVDVEPLDFIAKSNFIKFALLRRMGRSPLSGKFPMSGLLETIYSDVSRAVISDDNDLKD